MLSINFDGLEGVPHRVANVSPLSAPTYYCCTLEKFRLRRRVLMPAALGASTGGAGYPCVQIFVRRTRMDVPGEVSLLSGSSKICERFMCLVINVIIGYKLRRAFTCFSVPAYGMQDPTTCLYVSVRL